jgi:hypothetical protein
MGPCRQFSVGDVHLACIYVQRFIITEHLEPQAACNLPVLCTCMKFSRGPASTHLLTSVNYASRRMSNISIGLQPDVIRFQSRPRNANHIKSQCCGLPAGARLAGYYFAVALWTTRITSTSSLSTALCEGLTYLPTWTPSAGPRPSPAR